MHKKNNIHHLQNILKPNVYDRIITEITPTLIPTHLVQSVLVMYNDGTTVELKGSDLTDPVPVSRYQTPEERARVREHIRDIRIFVDTSALADEVDKKVDDLFRRCNLL